MLPGVIAQAIVPRGGSALIAALVAGIVSVPFTGGIGGLSLFLFIAVFQELPFLVTLWRRRDLRRDRPGPTHRRATASRGGRLCRRSIRRPRVRSRAFGRRYAFGRRICRNRPS
ncbi:ECF transporter S component [Microbacterium telephonicum]|uniref:ECF transporter S component n=1 Tax=Microbacterium telephonicum TaxID=1714841 RepID=UPI0013150102